MKAARFGLDLDALTGAVNMPSLPAAVTKIMEILRQDEVDMNRLTRVLEADPALAARVLRLSNSSIFGQVGQVGTLRQAAVILGFKRLQIACIAFAMVPMIADRLEAASWRFQELWRRIITAAVAARTVAQRVRAPHADETYLCGLLMDVGVAVLSRELGPAYWSEVGETTAGHPDVESEGRALGATHATVSGHLLKRWGLPPLMIDAVSRHHLAWSSDQPALAPDDQVAGCLSFGDDVATVVMSTRLRIDALWRARMKGEGWFGLDYPSVADLIAALPAMVEETAGILQVDVGPPPDVQAILDAAVKDLQEAMASRPPGSV